MEVVQKNYIALIKASNEKAFEEFFRMHYEELCIYASKILQENVIVEEIVQDVFVKIWEKRDELEISETSYKGYLYRTVHNKCLNAIEHKKVKRRYEAHNAQTRSLHENEVNDHVEAQELSERITGAIDSLPIERQRIFKMSRFEELKYKEIAAKLNISVKTVENQMGKALKFLREELKDYLPSIILTILLSIEKILK